MKTLLLLRHAKSSWHDDLPDHDRPLNKRGLRAAPRMGQLLHDEGLVPGAIRSSTAMRAKTTAALLAEACGFPGDIELDATMYLAAPRTYLAAASQTSDAVETLLLVGHNPGMETLQFALTGVQERFPTAALAQVELDIDSWDDVGEAAGRLVAMWRVRDLGA